MRKELLNYTQNRELSWLRFNERVLQEAQDPTVPLLERMKFVAIFTSNLDEFFMIRVGSLYDMGMMGENHIDDKTGWSARQQLDKIYTAVAPLYKEREKTYAEIKKQLSPYGICGLSFKELEQQEKKFVKKYFREQILPLLSPQIVDPNHPFPHLLNNEIYVTATLKENGRSLLGIVPVPQFISDILYLPGHDIRYIRMEKVIMEYLELIFSQYEISDRNYICVTRNADISPDDEAFDINDDFRYRMKKTLHKRRRMAVVRLEVAESLSKEREQYFCSKFNIKSTHNRRERPVYGYRGGSRGRFYYRITTFEGRPWDARDPHKTTFMASKHVIRLSIWQRQKETPGVEKAPGVSSPQRKESGRSGRDDGELRFGVRPGHPRKAVTSISQAEALAHGLAHLHLLCGATVRAVELDGIAALQDAVEDAFPSLIAGRVVDSPRVEVRGDDHGLARFVAPVDDGVDLLHHVARVSLRTQVLDEKQVVGEHAVEFALAFVERLLHEVHDVADIRLKRGEAEVDDAVGYRRGHVRFAGADIAEQEKAVGVLRVKGSRIALAQRRRVGGLAVICLEGAVAVEAARRKALLAHLLRLHLALLGLLALFALALLGLRAFAWDGHDA